VIHFFLWKEGGSTSHPSRVGLDTCLFFLEGRGGDPVRLRARGSGGGWLLFFLSGVFVLFVLLFFLCVDNLTLALFWGRLVLLAFVDG